MGNRRIPAGVAPCHTIGATRFRSGRRQTCSRSCRSIHAWLSEKTDSWMRQDAGGRLFAVVAQDSDHPDVLSVLDDAMAMQTPQTMAALASILRQASGDFIFSNPEFVARVLNSAAPLGQDSVDRLASAMHGAVSSGAYSGTPGQPFPQDVEQRNRARRGGRRLNAGIGGTEVLPSIAAIGRRADEVAG